MGGVDGARGVLLHCESRTRPGRRYWKVRLQSGTWVWPNEHGGLVVDGDGDHVTPECAACGLPFICRTGSRELICARCDAEQFGTAAARASDPPPTRRWNARRRWRG